MTFTSKLFQFCRIYFAKLKDERTKRIEDEHNERKRACARVCVCERERERKGASRDLQPRLCEETIKYSNARDGTFCVNRRPPFPTPATFGAHVWRQGGFHDKTPKINSNLSLNKLETEKHILLAVHE